MAVEFFVPGQPVGKGRPRATVRAGRASPNSDRPGVLVTVEAASA